MFYLDPKNLLNPFINERHFVCEELAGKGQKGEQINL